MSKHAGRRNNGTFEKGTSGNPKGRPSGAAGFTTLFNRKRDEIIEVKTGKDASGQPIYARRSRMEVWIENNWNKAINGDPKANANILAIMRATGQIQPEQQPETKLDDTGADVLQRMIERQARLHKGGESGEGNSDGVGDAG